MILLYNFQKLLINFQMQYLVQKIIKKQEDLDFRNFNDLEIEQKIALFTDIKLLKNDITNSQDEIYVHESKEIEDVSDNDFDFDIIIILVQIVN